RRFLKHLLAVFTDMQDDRSSDVLAIRTGDLKLRRTIVRPAHRLRSRLERKTIELDLRRHHESGIEAETEMPDHLVAIFLIFVALQKVFNARVSHLIDVLADFL